MKIICLNRGLVLLGGWFVILVGGAIVLDPVSGKMSRSAILILVITPVWLLLTAVSLCIYFCRQWRRVAEVTNKGSFIAWMGFESACTIALAGAVVWLFLSDRQGDSVGKMRELTLRQDLFTMRALINQFTVDEQRRPHSLEELLVRGYLKGIPTDPTTGRNDTWVLKCSGDPSSPGIESIESGHKSGKARENRRCD